jgi:hypothetical protein
MKKIKNKANIIYKKKTVVVTPTLLCFGCEPVCHSHGNPLIFYSFISFKKIHSDSGRINSPAKAGNPFMTAKAIRIDI